MDYGIAIMIDLFLTNSRFSIHKTLWMDWSSSDEDTNSSTYGLRVSKFKFWGELF